MIRNDKLDAVPPKPTGTSKPKRIQAGKQQIQQPRPFRLNPE